MVNEFVKNSNYDGIRFASAAHCDWTPQFSLMSAIGLNPPDHALAMVEFLVKSGCHDKINESYAISAADMDKTDVVKFLLYSKFRIGKKTADVAARRGNLDLVKLLCAELGEV